MLARFVLGLAIATLLAMPVTAQQHRQRAGAPPQSAPHGLRQAPRLPRPNHLTGDFGRLNRERWQGGHWSHSLHDGRMGWWWTVGPDWFLFGAPVYPFPPVYGPPGTERGWWYWCEARREYYPYVTYCPSGWRRLPPR